MITAKRLTDPVRQNGYWYVEIEITDSDTGKSRVKTYKQVVMTNTTLKEAVKQDIDRLTNNQDHAVTIPIGQEIDVTPSPPTPITQDQLDEREWFRQYRALKPLVDLQTYAPDLAALPSVVTAIADYRAYLDANKKALYLEKLK